MSEFDKIFEKLSVMEEMIVALSKKIDDKESDETIGEWISEKQAIKLTGLSRSTLYRLRKNDDITSSSLKEKKNFYRKSDINRLLDKNESKK